MLASTKVLEATEVVVAVDSEEHAAADQAVAETDAAAVDSEEHAAADQAVATSAAADATAANNPQ